MARINIPTSTRHGYHDINPPRRASIRGLLNDASTAYHPRMNATLELTAILMLLIAGCDEPLATTPLLPPAVKLEGETIDPSPEQETPLESDTEASAKSGEITGKVIHILDGDTIDILTSDKATIRIRFNGIDAPEKGQPFGNTAKVFLSDNIGGKIVRVVTHGKDRYGRIIGDVYCLDCTSRAPVSTVNVSVVTNGLAWHYVKYAPEDKELAGAERWAREKRLRLWSDRRSIPPWEWRKLSKEERDKLR